MADGEQTLTNPFSEIGLWLRFHGSAGELRPILVFAVAYFVACGHGSLFSVARSAPLWFPDSVLLCALLLTPRNRWWRYVTVALSVRLIPMIRPGVPLWFAIATFTNDALKALLAAHLLRRRGWSVVRLQTLA